MTDEYAKSAPPVANALALPRKVSAPLLPSHLYRPLRHSRHMQGIVARPQGSSSVQHLRGTAQHRVPVAPTCGFLLPNVWCHTSGRVALERRVFRASPPEHDQLHQLKQYVHVAFGGRVAAEGCIVRPRLLHSLWEGG